MSELRIYIGDLVDQYREDYDDASGWTETSWPTLYRFEACGKTWLTDRYWILPESVCVLPDGIPVEPLPASNIERTTGWLRTLADADVMPCDRVFAPCFAGTFTLAGLTARTIGGRDRMAALVTETGARIGILMPMREATAHGASLPVPDETVKLFRRIGDAGCVRYWQAWDLAVYLTAESAS